MLNFIKIGTTLLKYEFNFFYEKNEFKLLIKKQLSRIKIGTTSLQYKQYLLAH